MSNCSIRPRATAMSAAGPARSKSSKNVSPDTGGSYATPQDRLAAAMDRSAQGAFGAGEGTDPGPRAAQRGASRAALGQGRQGLSVRRREPACGAAFHVRARMERRLQELLVLGRRL